MDFRPLKVNNQISELKAHAPEAEASSRASVSSLRRHQLLRLQGYKAEEGYADPERLRQLQAAAAASEASISALAQLLRAVDGTSGRWVQYTRLGGKVQVQVGTTTTSLVVRCKYGRIASLVWLLLVIGTTGTSIGASIVHTIVYYRDRRRT